AHRLARGLGVSLRHGDCRLFMRTGEKLRLLVATVVNDRLLKTAETRSWIRGNIFDARCLDDIDHKVTTGPGDDFLRRPTGTVSFRAGIAGLRRRGIGGDLGSGRKIAADDRGRGGCGAL